MQRKKIKFFNFLRDKKIVLTLTIALFAISGSLYLLSKAKYSADDKYVGTISISVRVIDKSGHSGVKDQYIGTSVSTESDNAYKKYFYNNYSEAKTGPDGYTNMGLFRLVQRGTEYYIEPGIRVTESGSNIVKNIAFYITDSSYNKTGKQVLLNVYPLAKNKEGLEKLKNSNGDYRLPTIVLYSDKSGGYVGKDSAEDSQKDDTNKDTTTTVQTNNSQNTSENYDIKTGVDIPGSNTNSYNYKSYICAIYKYSLNVGFALTLLMIIYAGYRYLTSAGNEAAFGEAKDVLVNSLLGFAMLLLIRMILAFLNLPYCE